VCESIMFDGIIKIELPLDWFLKTIPLQGGCLGGLKTAPTPPILGAFLAHKTVLKCANSRLKYAAQIFPKNRIFFKFHNPSKTRNFSHSPFFIHYHGKLQNWN
jgi:hypothetical protein